MPNAPDVNIKTEAVGPPLPSPAPRRASWTGLSMVAARGAAPTSRKAGEAPSTSTWTTLDVIASFQFSITLPDGFDFVLNEITPAAEKNDARLTNHSVSASLEGKTATFICASVGGSTIRGSSGKLLGVKVNADESLEVDSKHGASLSTITISKEGAVKQVLDDIDFFITVTNERTILSENSETAPQASDGPVNVKVVRTINADTWNTICLPFAMTAEQIKHV